MIVKNEDQIGELRVAGALLSLVLRETTKLVREGATTAELDTFAEGMIREEGGVPAFLNYKPRGARFPYPAVLCVSVNEEVVHGIPSEDHVLKSGDMISLDLGLSYNGYFVDSAITMFVGEGDVKGQKLLDGTRECLAAALGSIRVGGHIGDIGAAVETVARRYQFSVVEELGGHAVGKGVHEKPFIANFGRVGEGEKIVDGYVLAIEPILAEGTGKISLLEDEWTYVTRDSSRSAHFEQTIVVTKKGVEILTPFL